MQRRFERNLESLASIYEFTEDLLAAGDIGDALRMPVHLAIEELFVNMVRYYPDNHNEILLEIATDAGTVTVTMTDQDVDPFDVSRLVSVDTNAPLEERTPGGLGLHLIHSMVDTIEYDHSDRCSTIKFTKKAQD